MKISIKCVEGKVSTEYVIEDDSVICRNVEMLVYVLNLLNGIPVSQCEKSKVPAVPQPPLSSRVVTHSSQHSK